MIDEDDVKFRKELKEMDMAERKQRTQKQMAWLAILSTVGFTIVLFTPWVSIERVTALSDLIGLFYISMAGVVAAFMGSAAYMSHHAK